jgi:hypothetical protein
MQSTLARLGIDPGIASKCASTLSETFETYRTGFPLPAATGLQYCRDMGILIQALVTFGLPPWPPTLSSSCLLLFTLSVPWHRFCIRLYDSLPTADYSFTTGADFTCTNGLSWYHLDLKQNVFDSTLVEVGVPCRIHGACILYVLWSCEASEGRQLLLSLSLSPSELRSNSGGSKIYYLDQRACYFDYIRTRCLIRPASPKSSRRRFNSTQRLSRVLTLGH